MTYRTFVFIHLVGVVLFFSGFAASLFLKWRADRTKDPRILSHTFAMLNFNDRWFTPPSIVLIIAGGFGAAEVAGLPLIRTGWIFWSAVLYGLSGCIFLFRALPLQRRLEILTTLEGPTDDVDWVTYRRVSRSWSRWATSAFLVVGIAFVLMVFQPALPSL